MKTFLSKVVCAIGFLVVGGESSSYGGNSDYGSSGGGNSDYGSSGGGYSSGYGSNLGGYSPGYGSKPGNIFPGSGYNTGEFNVGYGGQPGRYNYGNSFGDSNIGGYQGIPPRVLTYYSSIGITPLAGNGLCTCPFELQKYQNIYSSGGRQETSGYRGYDDNISYFNDRSEKIPSTGSRADLESGTAGSKGSSIEIRADLGEESNHKNLKTVVEERNP